MGLLHSWEYHRKTSEKAQACPHCGYPIDQKRKVDGRTPASSEKGSCAYAASGTKTAIVAFFGGMFFVASIVATGYFFMNPAGNRQKQPESIRSSSVYIAGDYIDNVPSWYAGMKPWSSFGRERPEDILSLLLKKTEPSEADDREEHNPDLVARGEQLVSKTLEQYRIDPIYNTPVVFGSRMVIWLPEDAWKRYSPEQKASIEAYMQSKYKSWGIGVGRVSRGDILADRLAIGTVGEGA